MKIYLNSVVDEKTFKKLKKGDILILEMPPFCSGDYRCTVKEDYGGLYVTDSCIKGCRDFEIKRRGKIIR